MVYGISLTDSKNRKEKIQKSLAASFIATGAGYATLKAEGYLNKRLVLKGLNKFNLTENEKDIFLQKAEEVIKQNGLENFGVKLKLVDETTPLPEDKKFLKTFNQIVKKNNACYHPREKNVYINRDFLTPVFHELGHAKNHQSGLSGKILKLAKRVNNKYIVYGIPLAAIFSNKMKPENTDKKLSNSEKTFNILRASTGVLVSLGFLPRLAEEYSASKRGYNMAKEAGLDEKLLNTINKNHKWGFKSYIRGAGMFAIAVTAAIQLKDFLENKMTNYHKKDLIK